MGCLCFCIKRSRCGREDFLKGLFKSEVFLGRSFFFSSLFWQGLCQKNARDLQMRRGASPSNSAGTEFHLTSFCLGQLSWGSSECVNTSECSAVREDGLRGLMSLLPFPGGAILGMLVGPAKPHFPHCKGEEQYLHGRDLQSSNENASL